MNWFEELKLIDNGGKKMNKFSRDKKAKELREKRNNAKQRYVVYAGYYGETCMYIGSGKRGREEHLNSGVSNVYQANEIHFFGDELDIVIFSSWATKKMAERVEKMKIQELKPKCNLLYAGDYSHVKKYRKALCDLANDPEYLKKEGVSSLLRAMTRSLKDDGTTTVYGKHIKTNRINRPIRCMARVVKRHKVERKKGYVYNVELDLEFLDAVIDNTTVGGKILWSEDMKSWGKDRAFATKADMEEDYET